MALRGEKPPRRLWWIGPQHEFAELTDEEQYRVLCTRCGTMSDNLFTIEDTEEWTTEHSCKPWRY